MGEVYLEEGDVNYPSSLEEDLGFPPDLPYNASPSTLPDGVEGEEGHFGLVISTLRLSFWLHSYGFGCLFFFLGFFAFFSILNLRSQISTRPYMVMINCFLCLLGWSRAAVLFIDPYVLQGRIPQFLGNLLWDLGFPSLLASFSLIHLAALQEEGSGSGSGSGSSISFAKEEIILSVVTTLHLITIFITAIYSSINPQLLVAKKAIQVIFSVWGILLCTSFLLLKSRGSYSLMGLFRREEGCSTRPPNEKGIANLFSMGLGGGGGQNLASSLTAALAPTLLQAGGSQGTVTTSGSVSSSKESPAIKIKVTDENERERTVSASMSDSSGSTSMRLNDIPEEGVSSPPVTSPRSSFSCEPTSSSHVRPPSPVLPRRKSSGSGGLRSERNPSGPRRLSWNRRDSGTELLPADVKEKQEPRKKSLTWGDPETRRLSGRNSFSTQGETLLTAGSTAVGPDYTLQSILSHIAYVNQTALDYRLSRSLGLSRSNQLQKRGITAGFGLILCLVEILRVLVPIFVVYSEDPVGLWCWFGLNTVQRLIELGMGAMVANITKTPGSRAHHLPYSIRHKHRESLYL